MIKKVIILLFVLLILLIFIDYKNFPTLKGYDVSTINVSGLGLIIQLVNVVIIVLLYWHTEKVLNLNKDEIERKKIESNKNQIDIAKLIVNECCKNCIEQIELLSQKEVYTFLATKVDFNIKMKDEPVLQHLKMIPFSNEQLIFDLSKSGAIGAEILMSYLEMKSAYHIYVIYQITEHDSPDIFQPKIDDVLIKANNLIAMIKDLD